MADVLECKCNSVHCCLHDLLDMASVNHWFCLTIPAGSTARAQHSQEPAKEFGSFQQNPATLSHMNRVPTSQQPAADAAYHQASGTYTAFAIDSFPVSRGGAHQQCRPDRHGSSSRSSAAGSPKSGSDKIAAPASRYDAAFPHLQASSGSSRMQAHNPNHGASAVASYANALSAATLGSSSNSGRNQSGNGNHGRFRVLLEAIIKKF